MKRIICLVLFALLVFSFLSPATSHADTYVRATKGPIDSNDLSIYGMDKFGDFVLEHFDCNAQDNPCFSLYVSGQEVSFGFTIPSLAYDSAGTQCGVGFDGSKKICNNGRELLLAQGTGIDPVVLYSGPPSDLSVIKVGSFGLLDPVMNSMGDFVFDDGNNFEEYIDVTSRLGVTPEPSSIAFLGTGLIGLAGIARRRCVR